MRTVIEGCAVATVDAIGTEYRDGHIVIEGDRIVALGEGRARNGCPPTQRLSGSTAAATWRRPVSSTAITTSTSGRPADSLSRRRCSSGWSSSTRYGR